MTSEGEPISRKDFLLFRNRHTSSLTLEAKPSSIETFGLNVDFTRIGNMNLCALMSDHDRGTWKRDGMEIEKLISQFSVVIPEYRPTEYKDLRKDTNPFISTQMQEYEERNYLFNEVERVCNQQNKDVWVVDPAHDLNFAILRPPLVFSEVFAELIPIPISICTLLKLSRREFSAILVALLGISGLIALSGSPWLLETIVERDLRNNVVAKFVADLSKLDELAKQDVLLIYPEKHWKQIPFDAASIKTYLEDEARRKARFNLYKNLFGNIFPSFFQIRHYPPII